jgi:hypothetical protein
MGRVDRALNPRLGRRVALKVLFADGASEKVRADAAARLAPRRTQRGRDQERLHGRNARLVRRARPSHRLLRAGSGRGQRGRRLRLPARRERARRRQRVSDGEGIRVTGAESVIAAIRPRLRACYQSGLAGNESLAGSMVVYLQIAPDGHVYRDRIKEGRMASPVVQKCALDELRNAQFEPPAGGFSELQIPIRFAASSDADASSHAQPPPK